MSVASARKWFAALAIAIGLPSNAETKSYKWHCVYSQRASPTGVAKDNFKMEFAYDDLTGKAVVIGNQGVADLDVHVGASAITFMEKLAGGVVQTTTVAKDGRSSHSRLTIISSEMVPTQYYGQCTMQ